MRRYARSLILIAILVTVAGLLVGIQKIDIGRFERGGDTPLGLSLGLDLQGGSHLVYRAVDTTTREPITPEPDQMESLKRSIERRVNASGLGEPIIQIMGDDRLLVQLPGVLDTARAKSLIGETAQLVWKHRRLEVPRPLDELSSEDIVSIEIGPIPIGELGPDGTLDPGFFPEGEVAPEAEATGEGEQVPPEEGLESSESETETEEATESSDPEGQASPEEEPGPELQPMLLVEFTPEGAQKFGKIVDGLRESLGLDAELAPIEGIETISPSRVLLSVEGTESRSLELPFGYLQGPFAQQVGGDPRELLGLPLILHPQQNLYALSLATIAANLEEALAIFGDAPEIVFKEEIVGKVDEDIGLTGDDLLRAYATQHSGSGQPIVTVEFNDKGTRIFGELTTRIAGSQSDQIAIFLDDKELISPVVSTAITAGSAIIQGRGFTLERVRDLGLLLESGSLPLTIELIQERSVDAILGADSLKKSVVAGSVGLALVLMFMMLFYRVPGLVAAVALVIYATLLLAMFKVLPVTLTLSGVAALILSVGMAVDANILIFERMKEELRAGRTLMSAINIGFNRAWLAIRDGNVSTLITCGVLFYFSGQLETTVVQGFAVALAIGVLLSMFSAIVLSRTFLRVLASSAVGRRLELFVPSGGADLPQLRQRAAPAAQRS